MGMTDEQVIHRLVVSAKLLIAAVRGRADRETVLAKARNLEDAIWKIRLHQLPEKEKMHFLIDSFCYRLDPPEEN